ncbi:Calx-beta domain-containing protein [Anatilimnocola sp. NA78]|uniref:Calx-beta domain-containing protein n=1 Tax=Anatilimnocola sp. NA78 TaxID=3415683 RepID=UPI003CE4B4EC
MSMDSRPTAAHANLRHWQRSRRRILSVEVLEHRLCFAALPAFSSLPGANHTIYLDFNGQTVTGTAWNSTYYSQAALVAQPFNIDSNPWSFSAEEVTRIEEAWKRTAEDFRPFNVNVTTVDPGIEALRKTSPSDTKWGIRVIVTNESTMLRDPSKASGAGGLAYVDSFSWSSDTPVWVFTTGGKSVGEAASHEVGHSLGLSHDGLTDGTAYYDGHGSGETSWAPIMGVSYYDNVTQWDRGEYHDTNNGSSSANYGGGPDDLAIIVSGNGFGYRADDHGNTNATATSLASNRGSISSSGIIERTTDIDVFSFTTAAGQVNLNIAPFTPGPNVDVKADLYNSSGKLVASSNSSTVLSAEFSLNLPAGRYYVHVDGTGFGNPNASTPSGYSGYASLGQYTISGTVAGAATVPVVQPTTSSSVSVGDARASEDAGTVNFTLRLSNPVKTKTTVTWSLLNGTAAASQTSIAATGIATFLPGQTTTSINFRLLDSSFYKKNDQFTVKLSKPTGITIQNGLAVGTIVERSAPLLPEISIGDVRVVEGNATGKTAQRTNLTFTLKLSAPSTQNVTVSFVTQDGTAKSSNLDYQSTGGTLTFSPGQTTKTVNVVVFGDNVQEATETFSLKLSRATNATLPDTVGVGTITNDDNVKTGNPARGASEAAPVVVADPLWYFEGPEANHDHTHEDIFAHDHHDNHDDHEHELDDDHDHLTDTESAEIDGSTFWGLGSARHSGSSRTSTLLSKRLDDSYIRPAAKKLVVNWLDAHRVSSLDSLDDLAAARHREPATVGSDSLSVLDEALVQVCDEFLAK